ncbi:MAG: aminotransferase class IV [Actinomycetales bacterium]|nr:aminotransferase class IV [Actinomycetales bacterium]
MRAWVGSADRGRLVDADAPAISVLDHGFTVADGVFETLKVVDGSPFALTRHLRRLQRSAAAMELPAPDDDAIREAVGSVLRANDVHTLARLRITYTAGSAPLGSDRGDSTPTVVVTLALARPWPATTDAITVDWVRNERSAIAGVKSTAYAENVLALRQAHRLGASEAILGNSRGELCEGTGSNVFVVIDGELLTPPLSSGCLAGITRELVLEWSGARQTALPLEALQWAEEVFITSSTREVHPVVRLDDRDLPGPGPISQAIGAEFRARSASDADP